MKIYHAICLISMVFNSMDIKAQKMPLNPFGLVYEGAITKNTPGQVHIRPVSYTLKNLKIAAAIYTPANYSSKGSYPALVIAHPNGGVKEQVSGLYAQRLAEQGFIVLVADAAYQGASEGLPRHTDIPANRIADIHGMADFILQFPGVDVNRLGLLGICGGGGYALKAAQGDKRFKRVATLSMFNTGRVRRNGFQDSQLHNIQERLVQASEARTREAVRGEISYQGTANPTDAEISQITTDLYREGYHYYYRTHAHPKSTFKYTTSSLLDLMTFDVNTQMELISQPLLMLVGSKADTRYMTDEVFLSAKQASYKELYTLSGATHIATYWQEPYVTDAIKKLAVFYTSNLEKGNSSSLFTKEEQQLIRIGSATALGNLQVLQKELAVALDAGITIRKLKEALIHVYAYAGFPRSIRGLQTLMDLVGQRKAQGIVDTLGAEASPISDQGSRYTRGKRILEQLTGVVEPTQKSGYAAFAPTIERFLKEHLFSDLFERDVLNALERELVSCAVIASIEGAEPMLKSHFSICLRLGLSYEQLQDFNKLLTGYLPRKALDSSNAVLSELMSLSTANIRTMPEERFEVFNRGERITNNNFIGTVYLQNLMDADSKNGNSIGSVTFEAGARTNWHYHPAGQIILAIDGEGYYQEKGKLKQVIKKGDVVKCPENIPHWHGASKTSHFVQVAITGREKGETVWLEAVTEAEYKN